MLNSEVLAEVLADLSSAELSVLDEAIRQAGLLLERERRYAWADEVARHPSRWPRGVAREDPEAHRQSVREAYTSLLWPELMEGRLAPGQEDALIAGLLGALDRGARRYSVVTALGRSGRRNLIPRIAGELRRAIGADALVVHQACYALRELLVVGWGRRLGQAERAVFLDAARAIGEAVTPDRPYAPASPATGYIPDPREAAV